MAKKAASSSHSKVETDAGCFEMMARNVRTIVIYELSVDLGR